MQCGSVSFQTWTEKQRKTRQTRNFACDMGKGDINDEEMPESYSIGNLRSLAQNLCHDYDSEDDPGDLALTDSIKRIAEFFENYSEFLDVEGPVSEVEAVCLEDKVIEIMLLVILHVLTPAAVAAALEVSVYLLNCLGDREKVMSMFGPEFVQRLVELAENPETSESEEDRNKLPELSLAGCLGTNYHIPIDMFNAIRYDALHVLAHLSRQSEEIRECLMRDGWIMKVIDKVLTDAYRQPETVHSVWDLLTCILDGASDLRIQEELVPFADFFSCTLATNPKVDIKVVRGLFDVCNRNIGMCDYVLQKPGFQAVVDQLRSEDRRMVLDVIQFITLVMTDATQDARRCMFGMVDWDKWRLNIFAEGPVAVASIKASKSILNHNFDQVFDTFMSKNIIEAVQRCSVEGSFEIKRASLFLLLEVLTRLPATMAKDFVQANAIEFISECIDQFNDSHVELVVQGMDYLLSAGFGPEFTADVHERIRESGLSEAFESAMDTDNQELFYKLNAFMEKYMESEQTVTESAEL